MESARDIFDYRPFWAKRFGTARELPTTRDEMTALGWDSCDVIIVTGDAYVDHPSFGMAVIGRLLEAHGFRVGIIAQPDWRSADDVARLGRPNLFFGVTGGNMDSMVNRYTADRRKRSDDAYTPDAAPDRRPDRAVLVYANRCREAFGDVPIVLGGIEASLRRVAHYDYWSEKVRRSLLVDAKADLLVYGNAERAIVEIAHRLAAGEAIAALDAIRGTALVRRALPPGWHALDATRVEQREPPARCDRPCVIRLPSYDAVREDKTLYAHASRIVHRETNPGNARPLVQRHGERELWLNPPPIPLTTTELDRVYELPYTRRPHSSYGAARIPAYEMIRFSVNIMRGCFGGCTFCSITEHEGRIIQNRSQASILREIEDIRDTRTRVYRRDLRSRRPHSQHVPQLACKIGRSNTACRRPSCVYPDICKNLDTDHDPLIDLYRAARANCEGVKKVLIASGLRYDLACARRPTYRGTGNPPRRRLSQDRAGAYRRRPRCRKDDETGHRQYLRPHSRRCSMPLLSARPARSILPDPLFHRRPSRHHRRGHDASRLVAESATASARTRYRPSIPSPMATATAMYHSARATR